MSRAIALMPTTWSAARRVKYLSRLVCLQFSAMNSTVDRSRSQTTVRYWCPRRSPSRQRRDGASSGVLGALAALHGSLEDMCQASSQLMRRILVAPWMSVALYRRWGRHGFLLGGEGARQPTDQGEQSCC